MEKLAGNREKKKELFFHTPSCPWGKAGHPASSVVCGSTPQLTTDPELVVCFPHLVKMKSFSIVFYHHSAWKLLHEMSKIVANSILHLIWLNMLICRSPLSPFPFPLHLPFFFCMEAHLHDELSSDMLRKRDACCKKNLSKQK